MNGQIGGQALPTPLRDNDAEMVVALLGAAIRQQDVVIDRVVVGGGMARRYPSIVSRLQERVDVEVLASACPATYKSAAPFGLVYAWQHGSE